MERVGDHAVVVGASMAGLLVARVLTDAYDRVTVLERDALPPMGRNRKGVPQGRHVHGILPRGEEIFEKLFPGLVRELLEAGAQRCDLFGEARLSLSGHLLTRTTTGVRGLQVSRPFLEAYIRERVRQLPNVEVVDRCGVVGLTASDDHRRITGVRTLRQAEEVLAADLVVDTTGRAAHAPAWLEALGYKRPHEESLRIDVGYASRQLRLPPSPLGGDKFIVIGPEPGRPRGLFLFKVEGERWILTLFGYGHHRPPVDAEAFWSFAATVAPPDVFEAIRRAEPLEGVATHRLESNLRRRYERLRRFPNGLVVSGDALCSFNPIYGQGMTIAALEAIALRRCLEEGDGRLAQRFFRTAAKGVDHAWKMATGSDLALPEVEGARTLEVRLINAYMRRLLSVAAHDPVVATAFIRVTGMLDPLPSLLHPSVALRIAAFGRKVAQDDSDGLGSPRPVDRRLS